MNIAGTDMGDVFCTVKAIPGATCVAVSDALGLTRSYAGSLLRELRTSRRVRSTGNTRGTRYYVRKGASLRAGAAR